MGRSGIFRNSGIRECVDRSNGADTRSCYPQITELHTKRSSTGSLVSMTSIVDNFQEILIHIICTWISPIIIRSKLICIISFRTEGWMTQYGFIQILSCDSRTKQLKRPSQSLSVLQMFENFIQSQIMMST